MGILVGEVFKMGSGDDGWKFKIYHADGGVLGGKQIYSGVLEGFTGQYDSFGLCDRRCVIEQYNKEGKLKLASNKERFCMSKWNDETKDMCWLTEDETEAWLGLIRGLKMMEKMDHSKMTIKSDAKKVLIDSLKEKNGMSGYIQYKLKFFNSENLVGTNYVIKVSSLEQEYGFDIFSHKSTCIATANYKNGN